MSAFGTDVRRAAGIALLALLTAVGVGVVTAAPAAAAAQTRYVATDGDDGTAADNDCTDSSDPCRTIQHAVDEADSGDTVRVAAGTYDEDVVIDKDLTVIGAGSSGASVTTIDGESEESGPSIWIRASDFSPEVTIQDLATSGNTNSDGIRVDGATVHVTNVVSANNDDAGLHVRGTGNVDTDHSDFTGNHNDGVRLEQLARAAETAAPQAFLEDLTVTISNAVISDNEQAGVQVDTGKVAIDHSTVSANGVGGVVVGGSSAEADVDTTTLDANIGAGVVVDAVGIARLTASTVSNTEPFGASQESGDPYGGGVLALGRSALVSVDNSTIFGNTGQGVLSQFGLVTVNNSTISDTFPPAESSDFAGGGVVVVSPVTGQARTAGTFAGVDTGTEAVAPHATTLPSTKLTGTIVADQYKTEDCSGTVVDGGYNLASDDTCDFTAEGSKNSGDAKLGPLADNGGPTQTLLPAKGSDAIDAIPADADSCVETDQRGVDRPQGANCDIGAVEADQTAIVISPDSLPNGTVGVAYGPETITATGGLGAPYVWSLADGSLPPGLTFSAEGVISGTPTEAGTFPFTVSVDDPTEKDYVIVIEAPAAPSSSHGTGPVADTGPRNAAPLTVFGATAIGLGALLLLLAGYSGRVAIRRYRPAHASFPARNPARRGKTTPGVRFHD